MHIKCYDCEVTKISSEFCDPSASEPLCIECSEGFWEMMGDDPCGKNWEN